MNSFSRWLACSTRGRAGVGLFFSLGASLLVHAQPVSRVQLPAAARGSAAIAALGSHLPTVAKAYGLEAQGLATLLQTQPSLGVDTNGALLFACDGLAVAPGSAQFKRTKT